MATENKALDEVQIRQLIEDKVEAVCAKDIDRATSNYAPDVLSFDVVNSLQYIGSDAIRKRRGVVLLVPGSDWLRESRSEHYFGRRGSFQPQP